MLKIHSIFFSIQGEGINTGVPSIFIRLAGCSMKCPFCDEGGDKLTYHKIGISQIIWIIEDIIKSVGEGYNVNGIAKIRHIVITGGEPLEQDILGLVKELQNKSFWVGLETNGSIEINNDLLGYIDTISLSPKMPLKDCKLKECDSLKILYPYYNNATAKEYESFTAKYKCIQPIWNCVSNYDALGEVIRLGQPWRLGLQVHKLINMK